MATQASGYSPFKPASPPLEAESLLFCPQALTASVSKARSMLPAEACSSPSGCPGSWSDAHLEHKVCLCCPITFPGLGGQAQEAAEVPDGQRPEPQATRLYSHEIQEPCERRWRACLHHAIWPHRLPSPYSTSPLSWYHAPPALLGHILAQPEICMRSRASGHLLRFL